MAELRRYGDLFATFFVPNEKSRTGLFLHRLRLMDTSTVYPSLLAILGPDGDNLPTEEREEILVDLESFLIRRMICGLTAKNYNSFFSALLRLLKDSGVSRLAVRDRLLASEDVTTRWPRDSELQRAWLHRPAYGRLRRDRVQMVMEALETQLHTDRQERLALDSPVSLEHVMPRMWHIHWRLDDQNRIVSEGGESAAQRRTRLVETFGNLTLLTQKLNSSVSNSPYRKKRPAITRQSALQLNAHFQSVDEWDEAQITRPWTGPI